MKTRNQATPRKMSRSHSERRRRLASSRSLTSLASEESVRASPSLANSSISTAHASTPRSQCVVVSSGVQRLLRRCARRRSCCLDWARVCEVNRYGSGASSCVRLVLQQGLSFLMASCAAVMPLRRTECERPFAAVRVRSHRTDAWYMPEFRPPMAVGHSTWLLVGGCC
jgi:hypothetical protein